MNNPFTKFLFFLSLSFIIGCGNSEKAEKEKIKLGDYSRTEAKKEKPEAGDDISNKGVGPINSLDVDDEIDEEMATTGAAIFKSMCSACHKMDKKYIGPALAGVTARRSHEWIMNMILNPDGMLIEDPIAKRLQVESNMAVMADQGLTEEDARALLEYLRSYDQK